MKNLNLRHAAISSATVYLFGILVFIGSYYVPIMEDPDLQANLFLTAAIIPAAYFGAYLYYRRGHSTKGLVLGAAMFLGAIILDAMITVPLFIIPQGGNHLTFFGDPGFWLIGLLYLGMVVAYQQLNVHEHRAKQIVGTNR